MARRAASPPPPKPMYEILRESRLGAGLSQQDLANKLGCKQSTICGWERDETCPDVEMIHVIAQATGVDRDTLIDGAVDYHRRFREGRTNKRPNPARERAKAAVKKAPAKRAAAAKR